MRPVHPLGRRILCVLATLAWMPAISGAEDAFVEGEVLVTFKSTVDVPAAGIVLGKRKLALARRFDHVAGRGRRVSGLVRGKGRRTAELMAELRADPSVEIVEPNYLRRISAVSAASDPSFPLLWGLHNAGQAVNGTTGTSGADTRFTEAWALARPAGAEIVVAVVDTGMDVSHPDLVGNLWTHPGEIAGNGIDDDGNGRIDDVHGYDFTGGTGMMTDSGDHGTHVAGTIAASAGNGIGIVGLQYQAKVMPLKVSGDGETMSTSAILAAYDYAISQKEHGVNVVAINASFGGSSFSTTERNAIQALRDAGIVLCAAAGNDATDNDTTASYPANYAVSNVISVASMTQSNQLSSFSNHGATSVDIAAPGSDIYSTMPLSMAPFTGSLKVGSTTYPAASIEYAPLTTGSGITRPMHACGLGQVGEFPAAVQGNIALIQRGTITFAEKLTNAMAAGAVGAVIYDHTSGAVTSTPWTLGSPGTWIPVLRISFADGQALAAGSLPTSVTLTSSVNTAAAYHFMDGTSMATPHVTAAVAFAAANFPAESMTERIGRILTNARPVAALAGKVSTGGTLDLLRMIDTDSDQLPDWWETDHFGTLTASAAGDPDGDGMSNRDEFLAATLPGDFSSRLAFATLGPGDGATGSDFRLTFPTVAEREYQVEWSNDLSGNGWQLLGEAIVGTGDPAIVVDPGALAASSRRYYRLRMVEP